MNDNVVDIDMEKFKKSSKGIVIAIAIIVGVLILFNGFTYRVDEREQVIVKQFNEVIKVILDEETPEMKEARIANPRLDDIVVVENKKGLFFKIPFIQTTESYTNMLITYDTPTREVITLDKKKLILDNFAQWKITNAALFVSTVGSRSKALNRLDDIVYSKLNEQIGKVNAHVIISDKDFVQAMLDNITVETNEALSQYGIEVIDIRIKRTDLPVENYENVFNRMRAEREKAATQYRSEGLEESLIITSSADKEARILVAEAYKEAETIKGQGDAEALKIYAEAYNQDPEFYSFVRTLQAYKAALTDNTTIVLDDTSEFAKYLYSIEPE